MTMALSVHDWLVGLARQRQAQQRNPIGCACEHCMIVEVRTASMGDKRVLLTRHGTLHGVWGRRGCVHSALGPTTKPHRWVRSAERRAENVPTLIRR